MASDDILELARQGDPQVLEALVNHSFNAHGVAARVRRQEDDLHILLEAPRLLNQEKTTEALCRLFQNLGLQGAPTVNVYHRQSGTRAIAWEQELELEPLSNPPHVPTEPEVQPPEYSSAVTSTGESPLATFDQSPDALQPEESALPVPVAPQQSSGQQPSDKLFANNDSTVNVLKRPEAVVLLLFVSIFLLWELYLELIDEANASGPLSGRGLARRLGVNSSTISRRKERPDFDMWTQDLDPDGIAWIYQDGLFVPKVTEG